MFPPITFIIGESIENLDDTTLPDGFFDIDLFPELAPRALDQGARYPRHANKVVAYAKDLMLGAKESGESVAIVTHCAHLLHMAGGMIAERQLSATDVAIWRFDGERPTGPTPSRVFSFDDDGVLRGGWPIGWFDPDF